MYTIVFFLKKKKKNSARGSCCPPLSLQAGDKFHKVILRTGLSEALIGGFHQIRMVIFGFSFDAVPWFRYIRETKTCMSRVIQEIKNAFHCEVKNSSFSSFFYLGPQWSYNKVYVSVFDFVVTHFFYKGVIKFIFSLKIYQI